MTKDELFARISTILQESFEIEPGRILPDANLYADLDIDSIDAVDLIDRLKKATGKKMSAEDFRTVRTVQDLVLAIERLQAS